MSDAIENSGRQYSQKPAAVYMRRYLQEIREGKRVRTPRKPKDTPVDLHAQAEQQSSPVEAPGAS